MNVLWGLHREDSSVNTLWRMASHAKKHHILLQNVIYLLVFITDLSYKIIIMVRIWCVRKPDPQRDEFDPEMRSQLAVWRASEVDKITWTPYNMTQFSTSLIKA